MFSPSSKGALQNHARSASSENEHILAVIRSRASRTQPWLLLLLNAATLLLTALYPLRLYGSMRKALRAAQATPLGLYTLCITLLIGGFLSVGLGHISVGVITRMMTYAAILTHIRPRLSASSPPIIQLISELWLRACWFWAYLTEWWSRLRGT